MNPFQFGTEISSFPWADSDGNKGSESVSLGTSFNFGSTETNSGFNIKEQSNENSQNASSFNFDLPPATEIESVKFDTSFNFGSKEVDSAFLSDPKIGINGKEQSKKNSIDVESFNFNPSSETGNESFTLGTSFKFDSGNVGSAFPSSTDSTTIGKDQSNEKSPDPGSFSFSTTDTKTEPFNFGTSFEFGSTEIVSAFSPETVTQESHQLSLKLTGDSGTKSETPFTFDPTAITASSAFGSDENKRTSAFGSDENKESSAFGSDKDKGTESFNFGSFNLSSSDINPGFGSTSNIFNPFGSSKPSFDCINRSNSYHQCNDFCRTAPYNNVSKNEVEVKGETEIKDDFRDQNADYKEGDKVEALWVDKRYHAAVLYCSENDGKFWWVRYCTFQESSLLPVEQIRCRLNNNK